MPDFIKKRKKIFYVLLIVVVFFLGIFVGFKKQPSLAKVINIANSETPSKINADFEPFWKVWNSINEKYPDADKVDNQKRVYGAIAGLVSSLNDPYSIFFNPEETKEFKEDIAGSFSGIGLEVGIKDGILTAISPLKDTPAYQANIKPGDKILKINDTLTSDLSIEEAIDLIRGEVGTAVSLTIFRDGEKDPKEIKIVRQTINVPTLETEKRDDGIFIIRLYSFTENSPELFKKALKEFAKANSDKLILDLRGNPGGYLEAAVNISSWFLPDGKVIVTEDYGDDISPKDYRSLGYDVFSEKLKFVILIDEGSASASEIVAGAMQDYKKAILVGTKSYGKGSVQELVDVTPDTVLKITVAKWLTPNGNSISEKGLTPDYEVKYTKEDFEKKIDPQLNKAVELLKNWPK
ncbi:MAG TPA: S41 family peptidase [Candidatus Paceibacterota bacterium]|nr:S41 family peptidase [Candidatus Paceibacterota bacterium]